MIHNLSICTDLRFFFFGVRDRFRLRSCRCFRRLSGFGSISVFFASSLCFFFAFFLRFFLRSPSRFEARLRFMFVFIICSVVTFGLNRGYIIVRFY